MSARACSPFSLATFSVCWAWINFSWFASAYDTDDWIYRLMTMLQMVGVVIMALGFPPMFASIEHGDHVDNRVMVAGYVVMRIALVGQWLRAAKQDPDHRSACLTYALWVTVAQIGWIRHHLPAHVAPGDVRDRGAADRRGDTGPGPGRVSQAAARRGTRITSPNAMAC